MNKNRIEAFSDGVIAIIITVMVFDLKGLGFGQVWDFGGLDKVTLLEQLALCWINLAILQKHGRGLAFKVLER